MDYVKFNNLAFVIDKDYVINNHNDASEQVFPCMKDGEHCYKVVRGLDKPCPDCPVFLGNKSGSISYDAPDGRKFYSSVSNIKFNNGSDGYIVTTSERDLETEKADTEIQRLNHKIDIFKRANYYCAFGYFDIDLSKDVITSDLYEVVDEKEYKVDMSVRGFKPPIRFSDYSKWFHDSKVVEKRDEYKEMTDIKTLTEKFNSGIDTVDLTFRARSTMGYLTWHRHSIYMYKLDGCDDLFALYVMRDIAFKFINDENSRRNEDIIKVLADEYTTVLYVDLETEMISFSNLPKYADKELKTAVQKMTYQEVLDMYIKQRIKNSDAQLIEKLMDKKYLIDYFTNKKNLSITFRSGTENDFKYMEIKIVKNGEGEPKSFIVGIADKDAEIRSRQEQQRQLESTMTLAQTDILTGIRNRTGYDICERKLNTDIENGDEKEFAIVMFDVNGLKKTNDIQGHDKGDLLLKNASKMICDIFKHSSVFRTGGDEFVAVLQNEDYDNREHLLQELRSKVFENEERDGGPDFDHPSIATGMAIFDPDSDSYVDDVLRRADDLMYENKKFIKDLRRARKIKK